MVGCNGPGWGTNLISWATPINEVGSHGALVGSHGALVGSHGARIWVPMGHECTPTGRGRVLVDHHLCVVGVVVHLPPEGEGRLWWGVPVWLACAQVGEG